MSFNKVNPVDNYNIPLDILDDISSRFIINLPPDERDDIIRVMFQIELGHWFYIDFHCETSKHLPNLNFTQFCRIMFNHIPSLRKNLNEFDKTLSQWKEYKSNVPTYGAIILDETLKYVLLVQGFWAKSTWGFPKGKVNHEEDPVVCACREVREETSLDCSKLIDPKEYIELKFGDTQNRLYIIHGVSRNEIFKPTTRNEIKNIEWFLIDEIPINYNSDKRLTNQFFTTVPFIRPLKRWIANKRTEILKNKNDNKPVKYNHFNNYKRQDGRQSDTEYSVKNNYKRHDGRQSDSEYSVKNNFKRQDGRQSDSEYSSKNYQNRNYNKRNNNRNYNQNDYNNQKQNNNPVRLWSKTWETFEIDWDEIWKDISL